MALPLIFGGLAAAGGIAKIFNAGRQEKALKNMVNAAGEYTADPNTVGNVALAKNLFNAESGASVQAKQLILGNQANTMATAERNATDSGQVLALANAVNANTSEALINNAEADRQNQAVRFGQLQSAVGANADQRAQVWADKMRKLNQLMGIKATKYANVDAGIGDITGGFAMSIGGPNQGGLYDILKLGGPASIDPRIAGALGTMYNRF